MLDKNEIIRSYRSAKNKPKQIGILADLHACSADEIRDVLIEAGYTAGDLMKTRRAKAAPAKKNDRISAAVAALREELQELEKREIEIPKMISALQTEFDGISGKRKVAENVMDMLERAFMRGGRIAA